MGSSSLGKRTRSSTDDIVPRPAAHRAKRQATTTIFNDENENENENATSIRITRSKTQLDELPDLTSSKSTPAKHGTAGRRVALSPKKISTISKIPQTSDNENSQIFQLPTPQTPRRRDAFSKVLPVTPRHRVTIVGKILTPHTPRTPSTPGNVTTIYNSARQLFVRSAGPGRLVGRDDERQELREFIISRIGSTTGGCIYVSGPPGTGKSALVNEIISDLPVNPSIKRAYVNCMSMKTSKDIYSSLLETFLDDLDIPEGEEIKTLQGMFLPRERSNSVFVVTLDEIDHVLTLDLEFMYKIFEWSLQKSSRLVLVGISNALDLTDRFLPRLKARNLKPYLLPFLPYSAGQIKAIIITRLKSLVPADSRNGDYVPFIHPAAIELCSRKVSNQTGDLRKAFDICRRAIELIEGETKQKHQQALGEQVAVSPSKKPLAEKYNLSSPSTPSPDKISQPVALAQSLAKLTFETAPRASIAHVNKITSSTLGNGTNQRLKTLNIQQKAALCALVALENRKRKAAANIMATPSKFNNIAPTVKALYDAYSTLCKRDAVLHPLTSTEFRDVVGSLETLSLISAVDGKSGSFVGLNTPSKRGRKPGFGGGVGIGDEKRVGSCVGERELLQAVEGLGASILTSILSGEGLEGLNGRVWLA